MLQLLYSSFTLLLTATRYLFFNCIFAISLYSVVLVSRRETNTVQYKYIYIDPGHRLGFAKEEIRDLKKEVANLSSIIAESEDVAEITAAKKIVGEFTTAKRTANYYQEKFTAATQEVKELELELRVVKEKNDLLSSGLHAANEMNCKYSNRIAALEAECFGLRGDLTTAIATAAGNATTAATHIATPTATYTAISAATPTATPTAIFAAAPTTANNKPRSRYLATGTSNVVIKMDRKKNCCNKHVIKKVNKLTTASLSGGKVYKAALSCLVGGVSRVVRPCVVVSPGVVFRSVAVASAGFVSHPTNGAICPAGNDFARSVGSVSAGTFARPVGPVSTRALVRPVGPVSTRAFARPVGPASGGTFARPVGPVSPSPNNTGNNGKSKASGVSANIIQDVLAGIPQPSSLKKKEPKKIEKKQEIGRIPPSFWQQFEAEEEMEFNKNKK